MANCRCHHPSITAASSADGTAIAKTHNGKQHQPIITNDPNAPLLT